MATTSDTHETEALKARIHALPQELFDTIYDLVFTPDPKVVDINAQHKPPHLLAIDRGSRQLFAARYYGSDNGFSYKDTGGLRGAQPFIRWLRSLHPKHKTMLKLVQYELGTCLLPASQSNLERACARLFMWFVMNGVHIRGSVLRVTLSDQRRQEAGAAMAA